MSVALLLEGAVAAGAQVVDSKFELFVTDSAESIHFYEVLGFSVAHAKPDGYSTLRSGSTVVALSPGPVVPQPWGDRDFRLTDPDGYYVRLSDGGAIP